MRKGQKLSDEQVDMIRWLVGVNQYELAKHFGVSQPAISEIQSGVKRKYGREKELDFWRDKEARSFTSAIRRTRRREDTGEKAGGSGKKRRRDWATCKTGKDFEKALALRKRNPKWIESIEKFREYHKKPDALYHAKINSFKTHCKRRHPLTGDNVYVQVYKGRTMRRCVTCVNMKLKERYAKQKRKTAKINGSRFSSQKGRQNISLSEKAGGTDVGIAA